MKPAEPPRPFAKGDRVTKRGFPKHEGTVVSLCADPTWVKITWDDGYARNRPKLSHYGELQKVEPVNEDQSNPGN